MARNQTMKTQKKVKICWISDVHLGFRQSGLQRRMDDFTQVHHQVVMDMLDKYKVDVIIDTGDLLHSNRPDPLTMDGLRRLNEVLVANEVPYLLISGNHDASPGSQGKHWVDAIGANSAEDVGGLKLIDNDIYNHLGMTFRGFGHMSPEEFRAREFSLPVDVVMLHAPVAEFVPFTTADMLTIKDLPLDRCKLCALGDIHINDLRQTPEGTYYGYMGSTELNSSSEPFQKYAGLFEFDPGSHQLTAPGIALIPLETRPVLKHKVKTTEELYAWIEEQKQAFKDCTRMPIVYLAYPAIIDALSILRAELDPNKWVLQGKPYAVDKSDSADPAAAREQTMTPTEFMLQVMKPDPDIAGVATEILKPDCSQVNELVDSFVSTML